MTELIKPEIIFIIFEGDDVTKSKPFSLRSIICMALFAADSNIHAGKC